MVVFGDVWYRLVLSDKNFTLVKLGWILDERPDERRGESKYLYLSSHLRQDHNHQTHCDSASPIFVGSADHLSRLKLKVW